MKRSAFVVPGIAVAVGAAILALGGPFRAPSARAASTPQFEAKFEASSDFYDRFDYGFSGISPLDPSMVSMGSVTQFHGDHDDACEGPDTSREVSFAGDAQKLDYSQLFWYCAPGGDATKGHVMTGVDTIGYNTAWFAPKPTFTDISQVCWDINETEMSSRKWTQVLFESTDDATRYPSDRGTGGYDLGYTSPEFRQDAPNNGIFPEGGTLAGVKDQGGTFSWFQNQDDWTTQFANWPGVQGVTDKAARYTHCLSNQPNNTVRLTQDSPNGTRTTDMEGQIPQGPVRVVFEDDNYHPAKDDALYKPDVLTWHWDNIQVFGTVAAEATSPPAVVPTSQPAEVASGPASPVNLSGDETRIARGAKPFVLPALVFLLAGAALVVLVLQRDGRFSRSSGGPTKPTQD